MFKPSAPLLACVLALSFSQNGYSQSAGMGGMPGGGMGGGMVPSAQSSYNEPLVVWTKPTGETPQWLVSGRQAVESAHQIRVALTKETSCDLLEVPLAEALKTLLADTNISFELDLRSISETSTTIDELVTLNATAPLRDILLRILKPLDLRYHVRDSYLLITSAAETSTYNAIQTYDLAHIMPDNANASQLVAAISMTIAPNQWSNEGGDNVLMVLGSLLVVRADEETQLELEKLLYNYSTSAIQSSSPATSKSSSDGEDPFD